MSSKAAAPHGPSRSTELWRGARYLAWREVRGAWVSFPATALAAAVVGVLAARIFQDLFVVEGAGPSGGVLEARSNAIWANVFMLVTATYRVVAILFNPRLAPSLRQDNNFTRHLMFLRALPVPAASIVVGRMLTMLLAASVASPAFFAAMYLSRGYSPIPDGLGFVWFALVWVGLDLVLGGALLYVWMSRNKRGEIALVTLIMSTLLLVAVASSFISDYGLAGWALTLARGSGALAGASSLLLGGAVFALCGWRATLRLQRRDLSA